MDNPTDDIRKDIRDRLLAIEEAEAHDKEDLFRELQTSVSPDEAAGVMAELYWNDPPKAAGSIAAVKTTPIADKDIRTIGLYYFQMAHGGAEKVVYLMGCMLQELGYRVVLFTDYEETPDDYVIPGVTRYVIQPARTTGQHDYCQRASMLRQIIGKEKIDLIIHNNWESPILMWDMCLLKLMDISVIVYTHNAFTTALARLYKMFVIRTYSIGLADGVIVLSEADKVFWSAFNNNVRHLPNPLDPKLLEISIPEKREDNVIVWVGRFEMIKRPVEAVRIMAHVVKSIPDVVLYMMGSFQMPDIVQAVRDEIELLGLQDNIVITGFLKNPGEYYRKARLQIITSFWEGYPMMMTEAQAYELPVVMYDIYHLDLSKDEYGVTSVPQGDSTGAAREVVRLLTDDDYYSERRLRVHNAFEELRSYDLAKVWSDILQGKTADSLPDRGTSDMVRLIRDHYYEGLRKHIHNVMDRKKAEKERTELVDSISISERSVSNLESQKKELVEELDKEAEAVCSGRSEAERLIREKKKLRGELEDIKGSITYRTAKTLTSPLRYIKKRTRKGKKDRS